MPPVEDFKDFLKHIDERNIHFKKHFYDQIQHRPISEKLVQNSLKKIEKIIKVEEQATRRGDEEKYKIWLKLSNKYSLVVIAARAGKDLYIITAWNTDRRWQKTIQK